MSGIFGFFNYDKPGRGINQNEKRKKGVLLFFELFFRKMGNYAKLNFLYVLTCIPSFFAYFFIILYMVSMEQPKEIDLIFVGIGSIALIIFLGGSPFAAGYNYVLRNFVREEHAFVTSDFFSQTMKNFKQAFATWIIDFIAITIMLFMMRTYFIVSSGNSIYYVFLIILLVFFALYLMMHGFIWTIIVTFNLKLGQIFKNAFSLTVSELFRNFLGFILVGVLTLIFLGINPLPGILFMVLVGVSMLGLINQMITYPTIEKYMMNASNSITTAQSDEIE